MNTKELLIKLLSYKSITPNDAGSFDFLQEYMNRFEIIKVNKKGVKNIFLYKSIDSGPHLCFAGHIDVVPPGLNWDSDPFTPIQKGDFIYARGAQDMKGGVAAFIQACKNAKNFKGTLSMLITSDEEGDAKYGTLEALKYLKQKNMLPTYAVVAEPSCQKEIGDTIKIGRRGSINGYLTIRGIQGHSAHPDKFKNPIELAMKPLLKICNTDMYKATKDFPPTRFTITNINAGLGVFNVVPKELNVMFNVRNSTDVTKRDIELLVKDSFNGIDYTLDIAQCSNPFLSKKDSFIVNMVSKTIEDNLHIKPIKSTIGGTSDGRFLNEFGIDVVEFGTSNNTIHSINERVKLSEVISLERVFSKIIKDTLK